MRTTVRFPSRSNRPSGARQSSSAAVERVEPRLFFHASAPIVPIDDISRPVNSAQDVIDLSPSFADPSDGNTRVAFGFDAGRVLVELYDGAAPLTVNNFLNYSRSERYDNTVIHRSAQLGAPNFEPFVIQGGGFRESDLVHVVTDPPVQNEFRADTQQRGTIAMAKQGGDPNSATSEWFFNLRDNRDILDGQNGGFTSFGQIITGQDVVDAIAALPKITQTAPAPFNSLSDFPVQNNPPATPQDYVNVAYISELPDLTGVATSSDPALVTPVVSGRQLLLNYTPGATGKATITVQAVDRTGAIVEDSFVVEVGLVEVAVGQGIPARTITYTDSDGSVGVVKVTGGIATLTFGGTGVTTTASGSRVTVTGTGVELKRITSHGGAPAVTIRAKGGADQKVTIDGISGGAFSRFVGRDVILRGTSDIARGIGRLDLFQTQDAEIAIGGSADGRLFPIISLAGAQDTDITSAVPIKSLKFGSWTSVDPDSDGITAPAVGTMQSGGDFPGALTITGAPTANTLNNVRINGAATGPWFVPGIVGNVSIGATSAAWLASFTGPIKTLAVAGDLAGTLNAGSVRSFRAGTISGATITLIQPTAAGAFALNSLKVKGAIANSNIRATASDVGTVSAGSIVNSTIYAGVSSAVGTALPDSADDFVAPATIRAVNVRNRTSASFVNSSIAASTLGRLNLGVINTDNGGVPFGLADLSTLSVAAADTAGTRIRYARLNEPTDSQQLTNFNIRVF